ncbi:hypothetical protein CAUPRSCDRAFT_12521 [Caulochytrium protostelioides]|nr:hypothetical protein CAUPRSCDRAFT_12521 [Caulochytrium protostelioides]
MLNSEKVRKRCVKAFGPGLLEPPKLDVIHLSKAMEDAASTPSNWPKLSVFRDYVASLGSVDSPHKIAVSHVLHLAIVRDYLISEMDKTWIARSLLEWKNLFVELNDDRPFRTELETAMSFLSNLQSVDVRFPLLFLSKVRAPESQPIEFTTTDTDPISPGALMADDATAAASWLRYFQAQASSGLKAQAIDAFHNEIIRVSKQFKPESLGWHSTTVRTLEWLQFADLFSGSISAARLRWPHGHRKDRVAWSADTQIVGDFGIKTIAVLRNNFMLAPPHPNPSNSFILRVPNNELDEYNKMRLKIAFVTS